MIGSVRLTVDVDLGRTPSVIAWREGLILTETLDPVAKQTSDTQELAQQLLEQARTEGVELIGPDGLLNRLTKTVLETALEAESSPSRPVGSDDKRSS